MASTTPPGHGVALGCGPWASPTGRPRPAGRVSGGGAMARSRAPADGEPVEAPHARHEERGDQDRAGMARRDRREAGAAGGTRGRAHSSSTAAATIAGVSAAAWATVAG